MFKYLKRSIDRRSSIFKYFLNIQQYLKYLLHCFFYIQFVNELYGLNYIKHFTCCTVTNYKSPFNFFCEQILSFLEVLINYNFLYSLDINSSHLLYLLLALIIFSVKCEFKINWIRYTSDVKQVTISSV